MSKQGVIIFRKPEYYDPALGNILKSKYEITYTSLPDRDSISNVPHPVLAILDVDAFAMSLKEVGALCSKLENTWNAPLILCGDETSLRPFRDLIRAGTLDFIARPYTDFGVHERIETCVRTAVLKERESRLRRQHNVLNTYLTTLINNLTFDFWVMDSDFRYVLQNNHSIEKWGDVLGKRIDDLDIPDDLKTIWRDESRRSFNGEIIRSEYALAHDGCEMFLESTISPVRVGDKTEGIVGITRDISRFKKTEETLNSQKKALEETNTALRVILDKREDDRDKIEQKITLNLQKLILPVMESLYHTASEAQKRSLDEMRTSVEEICSSFSKDLIALKLTTAEIQVANFIRRGKTTKEIAELLSVAASTINTHRNNIRIKAGIKNSRISLKSFLSSLHH